MHDRSALFTSYARCSFNFVFRLSPAACFIRSYDRARTLTDGKAIDPRPYTASGALSVFTVTKPFPGFPSGMSFLSPESHHCPGISIRPSFRLLRSLSKGLLTSSHDSLLLQFTEVTTVPSGRPWSIPLLSHLSEHIKVITYHIPYFRLKSNEDIW